MATRLFEDTEIAALKEARAAGINTCVRCLKSKAEEYFSEHGVIDPSTNTAEFGNPVKEEYYNTLLELANELEALK